MSGIGHERAHAPPFGAGDNDIAGLESTPLHQHGCYGAAATIKPRLNHGAFRRAVRVGLEIEHFGLQRNHIEQLVEVALLFGGNLDFEHVAAERLHLDLVLQQFGTHALRPGVGFVDFVDSDDDGDFRRLGVLDRFHGLRHDAVVGGDDQYDNVGDLGAARTHRRKGGVAGCIDEGDPAAGGRRHLISADVLRDAAGLRGRYVGRADGVEQRSLAVIDVAHDGDDRRARQQVRWIVRRVEHAFFDVGFGDAAHGVAEFLGDELGGVGVDRIGDLRHVPLLHQDADHVDRALGHAVGQLLDGDRLRDSHFTGDLFLRLVVAMAADALDAAAERSHRAFAHLVGSKGRHDSQPAAAFFGTDARCLGRRRRTRRYAATAGAARSLLFLGFEYGTSARFCQGCLGAEALLGNLVGFSLGFFVVFAALFFVTLARFGFGALGLFRFFAALPNARFFLGDLALFSFAQPCVGKRMSARAPLFLGERAQHDTGWLQRCARRGRCRRGRGRRGRRCSRGDDALRRCRSAALGSRERLRFALSRSTAFDLLDHDRLAAAMAEALAHDALLDAAAL